MSFMDSYRWWNYAVRSSGEFRGSTEWRVKFLFDNHGYKFPGPYGKLLASGKWEACPLCNGYGEVNVGARRILCACSCSHMAGDWNTASERMNIVVPIMKFDDMKTWSGDKFVDAVRYADYWLKSLHQWISIVGPTGTGKTSLMCGMYHEHSMVSAYITAKEIEQRLWLSVSRSDGAVSELVEYLSTVPILFLDDLGQELGKDFTRTTLWQIINSRYQFRHERLTVMSTNMNSADLWGWSNSIAGRLLDSENTAIVEITGADHRRKK